MNLIPVHAKASVLVSEIFSFRLVLIILLALFLFGNPLIAKAGTTELVSVAGDGTQGNSVSTEPAISSDGRYIVFSSYASNLVPNDTNGVFDLFVFDRVSSSIERVNVASDGTQSNHENTIAGSINADGRYVCFFSASSNLVPNDTNGVWDVFVRDRVTNITERVSVATNGSEGEYGSLWCDISANGRYVVFVSQSTLVEGIINPIGAVGQIYVHDRILGTTEQLTTDYGDITKGGNNVWGFGSTLPSISVDGRYVVFSSISSNIVPADNNEIEDIFLHDRNTGSTRKISVASDGTPGNGHSSFSSISPDGRFIAFSSRATNLVSDDTNGADDIFLHNLETGTTEIISVASDGVHGNKISRDPDFSDDGRFITFWSIATNLVSGDTNNSTDVFVYSLVTKTMERISVASDGTQGNNSSFYSAISGNGQSVVFVSKASNLVSNDTNGVSDVFIHDRLGGNNIPLANAGPDQTVSSGALVQLDGSTSTDPDGDLPLTYAWQFTQKPAGSVAVLSDSTSAIPTFTTDVLGDYTVTLVVTDSKGKSSAPDTVVISTVNSAPIAAIAVPSGLAVIQHGTTVQLDGSGSGDPDGDTLTFNWILTPTAGSTATLVNAGEIMPSFVPDMHGDYVVKLIVTDIHGANSVPVSIIVTFENLPPVASASYAEVGQVLIEGDTINLSGSGTDANLDTISNYTWTLTAPVGSAATLNNDNAQNPSVATDIAGDYTASLVVQDEHRLDSVPFTLGPITVLTQAQAIDNAFNDLSTGITALDPGVFNKAKQQNRLIKRLGAVSRLIDRGKYKKALKKLRNKILRRTNGCSGDPNGTPDGNDWIDCGAQAIVLPLVNNLIYFLSK